MDYSFMVKELPVTTNAGFKVGRGRFYQTQEYKDFKQLVWMACVGMKPTEEPVSVQVDLYMKRDRDLDGGLKVLLDSMNRKVYVDDTQVMELIVTKNRVEMSTDVRTVVRVTTILT